MSGRSGSRPEVHAAGPGHAVGRSRSSRWPELDLSGSATGRLDYAWKGNRSGRLDLKIRGLSRAGLVLASKPIDVGLAAIVSSDQAALRAVAASDGAVVGRAQARFAPIGGGPLFAELMNAPLFAQLRYAGRRTLLWRLTGSEVIDMSGPLAIGADIGGRLADPVIRGALRTQNARLESPVTGMVIQQLAAQARFSGPQLIFSQITGTTAGGGSISGQRQRDLLGGRTALNLSFNADQALLLNRDDVAARVTRPVADPFGRAGRHDLGRPQAQQGPLPARPRQRGGGASRSSMFARRASTQKT